MGFGDVEDDYDPAHPNDYMEYCRERINKKKQEERDRELKIIMEEQEREVGTMTHQVLNLLRGVFLRCRNLRLLTKRFIRQGFCSLEVLDGKHGSGIAAIPFFPGSFLSYVTAIDVIPCDTK